MAGTFMPPACDMKLSLRPFDRVQYNKQIFVNKLSLAHAQSRSRVVHPKSCGQIEPDAMAAS